MNAPRFLLNLLILNSAVSSQLEAGTVTTIADSGPGSLRNVLAAATNGEIIDFDPSLNGATITLTSGGLEISDLQVSIDASSLATGLSISGDNTHRVLGIIGSTSDVTLKNITIRNGKAMSQNGGGIFLVEGNLQMFDCTVTSCFASFNGGGVNLAVGVTATLDRCRILGNSCSSLGFGGGIFIGGAAATSIRNSVISGNTSPSNFGGGISMDNSSPNILNCTIQGNTGGGIRCDSSSNPQIINSICWGNGGAAGTLAAQQVISLGGSLPVISHSLIEGAANAASFGAGNPVTWSSGNLNGTLPGNNPRFVNTNNDLRLLATSSALDAGNNLANPGSLDAAGAARIQNSTVDLGAYEGGFTTFAALYPSLDPAGDANHNGISNLQEYGMGFEPAAVANPGAQPTLTMDGGDLILTVNQRPNTLDLSPVAQTSTALDTWSTLINGVHFTTLTSTPVNSNRSQIVFRLLQADPKRFYRQAFTILP
jgi:parallel beta-helix repeat protein